MAGAFQRLTDQNRTSFEISIDGDKVSVLDGDTVLTAILLHQTQLRQHEINGEMRAGFCLMGACQDCWVNVEGGGRVRACTTQITEGMCVTRRMAHP